MFYGSNRHRPGSRGRLFLGSSPAFWGALPPFLGINFGTINQNVAALAIKGTWNNSGVTFDAPFIMNVTNTASASGSLLMDIRAGTSGVSSMFSVDASGNTKVAINAASGGSPSSLTLDLLSARGGFYGPQGNQINMAANSKYIWAVNDGSQFQRGMAFASDVALSWDTHTSATLGNAVAVDNSIYRDTAVGVIAHGSGATPQGFRVYNTTDQTATNTAPTNYERAVFDWVTTANQLTIGTQAGGTGTARSLVLTSAGSALDLSDAAGLVRVINVSNSFVVYSGAGTGQLFSAASGGLSIVDTQGIFWLNHANLGINWVAFATTAPGVIKLGFAGGTDGWLNYQGEIRSTADTTTTSTALGSTVALGLSVPLLANRNYSFRACLFSTCSTTGGLQVTLNSTTITGSTDLRWHAYQMSANTITSEIVSTAFGTLVGPLLPSTTNVMTFIDGTITNTASSGNLQIWFSQDVSTTVVTSVKKGSYLIVDDMP